MAAVSTIQYAYIPVDHLPHCVRKDLVELYQRVRPATCAWRLWTRHFEAGDQQQFKGDFQTAFLRHGTIGMWMEAYGVSPIRALLDAGCALGFLMPQMHRNLLRETGESDGSTGVERAIQTGALVLTEERKVYFNRAQIEYDWHNHEKKWSFLWKLARLSKRNRALDYLELGGNAKPRTVADYKNRLQEVLPADLFNRITSRKNEGCRVDLPPSMIRLFVMNTGGDLAEWSGWEPASDL